MALMALMELMGILLIRWLSTTGLWAQKQLG
jgi:hypothetical protein